MSGRKASEVSSLLRNGKSTRSGAIDMLNSSYEDVCRAIRRYESEITDAKNALAQVNVVLETAEREFPESASQIKDAIAKIKKNIESKKSFTSSAECDAQYRSLMSEFEKIDSCAESVANRIRNKSHYCDSEYAEAERIAGRYRKARSDVYDLQNVFQSRIAGCMTRIKEIKQLLAQKDSLVNEGKSLEKKAKDVKTLRENAQKAKTAVKRDFEEIDETIAKKFLKEEYDALRDKVSAFLEDSDRKVVSSAVSLTSAVGNFSIKLNAVYAEFLKQQEMTQAALEAQKNRVNRAILKDPWDEYKDNESREFSLIEFLGEHCNGKFQQEIQSSLKEAQRLFQKENFDSANKCIADLTTLIDKAAAYAAQKHEQLMQTIDNALAIRKVMLELNYDVRAKMKTDKNGVFNGYIITCTAGDEEIVLDNVNVGEDGKLKMDIDHKESTSGTCGHSWQTIRNAMMNEGVPIKDILKDGKSVIFNNPVKKISQTAPTQVKQKSH